MSNCNKTPECGCMQKTVSSARSVSRPCGNSDPNPGTRHSRMMPSPCAADSRTGSRPQKADALSYLPVGMAYVPWQHFHETYELDKALQYGTIFPELNKPFYGKGGCRR